MLETPCEQSLSIQKSIHAPLYAVPGKSLMRATGEIILRALIALLLVEGLERLCLPDWREPAAHLLPLLAGLLAACLTYRGSEWIARSDCRQVAESLSSNIAMYRAFMDRSPAVAWIKDEAGRYVYANAPWIESFASGRDTWKGRTDEEIWPPDVAAQLRHMDQQVLHTTQAYRLIENTRDSTGLPRSWQVEKFPLRDSQGRSYVAGIALEITEHVRAEEALRRSEARYRALVENCSDMFTIVGAEGRVLYVSPSVERILGYTPEERLGLNIFDSIHPEDLPRVREEYMSRLPQAGATAQVVYRFRHKDGSWRYLESIGKQMLDMPDIQGVFITTRDVTKRRQAEEELRKLSCAVAQSPASIIITDTDGKIQYVNPKFSRMTGYAPDEVIGRTPDFLMSDENSRAEYQRIWETITGGNEWRGVLKNRRKDGEPYWEAGSNSPIKDEEGRISHYISVKEDITEFKRAAEKIEHQLTRMNALRTIDIAITASFDLRMTLQVLIDQAIAQLGVEGAHILLLNPHSQTLEYATESTASRPDGIHIGEGLVGRAALERRVIALAEDGEALAALQGELAGMKSYYAAPLIARGQVKGVLEVYHHRPLQPDGEWLDFLETLAGQAAIAIDNAGLFNALQRSNAEMILAYDATIEAWSRFLDLKDEETEGHSRRVTELTVRLARRLNISDAEIVPIRRGALLHDIGKMGIPDSILLKDGPLTDAEWEIMRKHPVYAYEMLSPIAFLHSAIDIPYCHHERWDGTGYPRGLKGEQIPLAARIFAIVDVWDALRSDRPYRSRWSVEQTMAHIEAHAGTHFDPCLTALFMEMMRQDNIRD